MRSTRRASHRLACLLAAVFVAAAPRTALTADVPEPESYWMGAMHGDVPATLAHGKVVHTQDVVDLMQRGAILLDVADRQHRPASLAPDAIWKPSPHRDIPGSVWLPGTGVGKLDPTLAAFYEKRLAALTKGDTDKAIVVYCHLHCWASWNAAKRAIALGYRNVHWYPDGIEGWQEAGHEVAVAADESPAEVTQ